MYFFFIARASRTYRCISTLIFKFDYSQSTHMPYEYFILHFTHVSRSVHDTFVIQRAALIQANSSIYYLRTSDLISRAMPPKDYLTSR